MFGSLFYLWRFAGVAVYADMSLLVLMVIWLYPALTSLNLALALDTILFAVLFFGSIALHEFGHSLTAIRLGYPVHKIILNILGGAAIVDIMPRRGSHECLIAVAGPVVSVLIGFACQASYPILWQHDMHGTARIVALLALANYRLAIFNLIPAFPLDGGRILRGILTPHVGRLKSTAIAARVGQTIAMAIGCYSIADLLIGLPAIGAGFFVLEGSIILTMICLFIYFAAESEYRMVAQEEDQREFRWSNMEFREGDGDRWRNNTGDISKDVEVGPPPFDRDRDKGLRGFFRRLFKR